jgi:hypothetical protein
MDMSRSIEQHDDRCDESEDDNMVSALSSWLMIWRIISVQLLLKCCVTMLRMPCCYMLSRSCQLVAFALGFS